MRLAAIAVALVSGSVGLPASCRAKDTALSRFEFTETHMGSPFQVVLYTTDEAAARQASQAAFRRIAELDAALSDYNPDSELMRLCDHAGGPPVKVSSDLLDVLQKADETSRCSQGAFDVTVGPAVRLWRRARRNHKMPDPETLARARALVGYEKIRLDPKRRTVQLLERGMRLDLGGIAKGYAAQAAIDVLRERGITRALVGGAGDIVVAGPPPGTAGWTIGIAPLEGPGARPTRFLLLHDCAISTSGDTAQFVEIDGRRYSHIVDPKTGLGLVDRSTVTIVARDGGSADALATAASVLGPERGLALIDATDGAAALMLRATPGGIDVRESKRWHFRPPGPDPSDRQPGQAPARSR